MEAATNGGRRGRAWHATIGAIGAVAAGVMCVGALGPWAHTPVISFSGWAGIGLPLVVLAFVALAIEILHAFVPRRFWLVVCLLIGAFNLVCAIILGLLEGLLSHAGSLLSLLIARGAHKDLLANHPVTLGWGIPVLGVAAFVLIMVSITGLFGKFSEPMVPSSLSRRIHSEKPSPFPTGVGGAPRSDDDLFNTR